MEKITLENGEEVKLQIFYRKVLEYEKEYPNSNIVKVMADGGGIPNFTVMAQLIYIGYKGGGNKTDYTFNEFVELLPFDIKNINEIAIGLIRSKKK